MPPQKPKRKSSSAQTRLPRDKVSIDFVVLGDFAQTANGKLTVVGAGWNIVNAQQYPQVLPFGIGIGILVPWGETNRKHEFKFIIRASEGPELASGGGEFEAGRQPGMPPGMTQRLVIGIAGQMQVPSPGTYEIMVESAGDAKRIHFEALPVGTPFKVG